MEQINKSIQYGAVTIKKSRSELETRESTGAAQDRVRWKAAVEALVDAK